MRLTKIDRYQYGQHVWWTSYNYGIHQNYLQDQDRDISCTSYYRLYSDVSSSTVKTKQKKLRCSQKLIAITSDLTAVLNLLLLVYLLIILLLYLSIVELYILSAKCVSASLQPSLSLVPQAPPFSQLGRGLGTKLAQSWTIHYTAWLPVLYLVHIW